MGNVVYYGIDTDRDLLFSYVNKILRGNAIWQHMKIRKRVQNKPHITLAHVNSLRENRKNKKAWQDLGRIFF